MRRTVRQDILDRMIQYYLALRMSAAASMPMAFTFEQLDPPAPVIRFTPARMADEFDPRELVRDGEGHSYIVVMDDARRSRRQSSLFLN